MTKTALARKGTLKKKQNLFKPNVFKFTLTFYNYASNQTIYVDFEQPNQYVSGLVSSYCKKAN